MLTRQQRWSFFALQSHYPTTAIAWVGGITLTMLYLLGGVTVTQLPLLQWTVLFGANLLVGMLFILSMRRFNLVEHERRSWGFTGSPWTCSPRRSTWRLLRHSWPAARSSTS